MAMGQQAAMRVGRQTPAEIESAAFDKRAGFAFGAETKILEFDQHHRREAVIDAGHIDVGWAETCHLVGAAARLDGCRGGQTARLANVLVAMALARAEQIDRMMGEIGRALGRGQHEGRAAVRYE